MTASCCDSNETIFRRLFAVNFRQHLAAFNHQKNRNFSNIKMSGIQVLSTPTKSTEDVKDYKMIQLPNGLKVK